MKKQKIIKAICNIVKKTPEYKGWVKEIKSKYTSCEICGNTDLPLELHHYPQTMFEVCNELYQEDKTTLENAQILLENHLNGAVSYKIVCKCCHLKFHIK